MSHYFVFPTVVKVRLTSVMSHKVELVELMERCVCSEL